MDENSLQSMSSTLPTNPRSSGAGSNPQPTEPVPQKRAPGRPKGSVKKNPDPNAPPKVKRPVGRPRKDGLPAGSVQRSARPVGRPRKRQTDSFNGAPGDANTAQPQPAGAPMFPYGGPPPPQAFGYMHWPPGASGGSATAGPMPHPPIQDMGYPIDPALEQDSWAHLLTTEPQKFLKKLVESLSSPNPTSASGTTVEEAFKSHLTSLAPSSKTTPSIPNLYAILKTFWLPSSPAYFSLTGSANSRTTYEYRFIYWDPHPLVFNGIACPNCSTPLINRGRIRSGPLKIHDLNDQPFFIIGCEYVCTSAACVTTTSPEGRRFSSTDASIFGALPAPLKNEFPARLAQGDSDLGSGPDVWNWQAMGVSHALWNMVRGCLKEGLRKQTILKVIKGIQEGVPGDSNSKREDREDEEVDRWEKERNGSQEAVKSEYHPARRSEPKHTTTAGPHTPHTPHTPHQQPPPAQSTHNGEAPRLPIPMIPQPSEMGYSAGGYQYPYGLPYIPIPPPHNPDASVAGASSQLSVTAKRPYPFTGESTEASPDSKRIRHCSKCGSSECKGKGGRAFCQNACQDCGKIAECKGRNSKRPDKTCANAWT